ncbi:unnamed protein product [Angiostrongylus costaricensis]|uniref:Fanconi anemia group I protein n=1 Tax=Angiostrongylus costaricensis TaxID=334426 RepID=A0A0R3PVP6_ANGCS|nr:unnamed protein product [Angiostrongylus costaricensis]
MAFLKRALHLLELIEDRRYGDATALTKSVAQEENGVLEGFAPDLIYKVAYSFGNEDNPHLKDLLMGLFSLMLSVEEKYRLCYELLTLRTSPELTEVLVSQLGTLISTVFQTQHPKLWSQLCDELPLKLEQRLCQRLANKDEDAIVLRACYMNVLPIISRFGRLVDRILSELPMEEAATYPFLIWHAREHPFSPKLEMFLLLLRFIDDIGSETRGVAIMAMLQGIISYFPVQPRALLLKNIVFGITSKTANESKALAWLLDQFEHHLNEKVFEDELGSVFGVLEDVIYDDIVDSRSFYASLLRLIRSFTRNCSNTKLLAEVRKRLIVRLHEKLVEYLRLDVMNEKSRASQADQILSVELVCPSSSADEEAYPLIVSVLKDCEETLVIIDGVLQNSVT